MRAARRLRFRNSRSTIRTSLPRAQSRNVICMRKTMMMRKEAVREWDVSSSE